MDGLAALKDMLNRAKKRERLAISWYHHNSGERKDRNRVEGCGDRYSIQYQILIADGKKYCIEKVKYLSYL